MAKDQPLHMWDYFCGEFSSVVQAVEDAYPNIAKEPEMAAAITTVKNGERLIASIMAQKVGEAEDEEDA